MGVERNSKTHKHLFLSMISLVIIVILVGFTVNYIMTYLRSQDPIYQCVKDPKLQAFQISIPAVATRDGYPMTIPRNIGVQQDCVRPIHTSKENQIDISYGRPYPFTLGHFLYIWGVNISKYDVRVNINNSLYINSSSYLDIVFKRGMSIRIDFDSKNKI